MKITRTNLKETLEEAEKGEAFKISFSFPAYQEYLNLQLQGLFGDLLFVNGRLWRVG